MRARPRGRIHSRTGPTSRLSGPRTTGPGATPPRQQASRAVPSTPPALATSGALAPILACYYAVILGPLVNYFSPAHSLQGPVEAGIPNRIFWPSVVALALIQTALNLRHPGRRGLPPHITCLLIYFLYAGMSTLWALKPEASFVRYTQQMLVLASTLLPTLSAAQPPDTLRGLSTCFFVATVLNVGFLFINTTNDIVAFGGYMGYFEGKNYLGEFSALAVQFGVYGTRQPGMRRIIGIITLSMATILLLLANSKTSIGLAPLVPILAWIMSTTWRRFRISPAILLLSIPALYLAGSMTLGLTTERLSYIIYHDSTLTGRTIIWEFVKSKIAERPFLGWGYQSFWLIGPESPAVAEGPGFVKMMPNGHNGYYDTTLELGYVGLALLLMFVLATVHATRRVADRDPERACFILSLCLLVIFHNFLESFWMRGFEMKWVLFLLLAVDIARYQGRGSPTAHAHSERHRVALASAGRGSQRPRTSKRYSLQSLPER